MKVLLNEQGVIITKGKNITMTESGYYVDTENCYYSDKTLTIGEIPDGTPFDIQADMWQNGQVVPNPYYSPPPRVLEEFQLLQEKYELLSAAMDELIMGGGL